MQKFEFLQQPLLGELAMSWRERKREERERKNAIYSGHLRLCQEPRAAHALRSDQNEEKLKNQAKAKKNVLIFLLYTSVIRIKMGH